MANLTSVNELIDQLSEEIDAYEKDSQKVKEGWKNLYVEASDKLHESQLSEKTMTDHATYFCVIFCVSFAINAILAITLVIKW